MVWLKNTLWKLISVGVAPEDDADEQLKKRIVGIVTLFCLVGLPADAAVGMGQGPGFENFSNILLAGTVLPLAVFLVLARTKRREPIQEVMLTVMLLMPGILHVTGGGTYGSDNIIMWGASTPVVATLLSSPRVAGVYFLIYFVGTYTLVWLDPVWTGEVAEPSLAFFDVWICCASSSGIWVSSNTAFLSALTFSRSPSSCTKA